MIKKGEKILTKEQVITLGLDKVSVITRDMLEGYTGIGFCAFAGCHCLKSIEIPNNITSIGEGAFGGCDYLESITIPNSVTSIESGTFWGCDSLTSVTIPNSITSIGGGAFYGCSSLTSVTIPNSITSIGYEAFAYCKSLTSVIIPDSITSIGEAAFYGCNSLTTAIIRNEIYEVHKIVDGKCKAYKGFGIDMKCRDFQYEEGKTYELNIEPKLCELGFHACLNIIDVFSYYYGEFGEDIVIYEVELEGVSNEMFVDSKIVGNKITIGKRIL